MLDITLRCIQVFSLFEQSTKQTLCVRYFTVYHFWVHFVMEQLFKQTLSVIYSTKMHSFISMILPVNKEDTIGFVIYYVNYEYIFAFNCDSRKTIGH